MIRTSPLRGKPLGSVPMTQLNNGQGVSTIPWLWHGLVARENAANCRRCGLTRGVIG
jgi:hypothetical protein